MYPAFFALVLFLLVPPSSAQHATETAPQKCTLEGRVVKTGSGEPIKKARVTLQRVGGNRQIYNRTTDASGRFILKRIEAGRYRLWAARQGYVGQEYGQRGPNRAGSILSLEPSQTLRNLIIRLIPAAVITGQVYDEDGEPIAGVMVQVMRQRYLKGGRELVQAGADRTDDLGEYRVYGLTPGKYYVSATLVQVSVSSSSSRRLGGEGEVNYPPTYYPGTNDLSQAVPLEVGAGVEVRAIDFTLLPARSVRIRGRVFNAVTGEPGRGTLVMLYPQESGVRRPGAENTTYVDDPQGTFEIAGVTPGSYNLHAVWSDGKNQYVGRLSLDVWTSDIEDINLVIGLGARLSGRIRLEGNVQAELTDLYVSLQSHAGTILGKGVKVQADGNFVLSSVPQGDYWVNIFRMPENWYLKSAYLGGEDVLVGGVKISTGLGPGSLELVLSSAGGRIDGVVLKEDQQPVPAAYVVLVPERRRRDRTDLYKITTADQNGRFTLRGLPPGEYTFFAWEEVESGAYYDPDFLRRYEKRGKPVHLREADRLSLQLELIPADEAF